MTRQATLGLLASLMFLAIAGCTAKPAGTPGEAADGDGDGFPDALEKHFGTDPTDAANKPSLSGATPMQVTGQGSIIMGLGPGADFACGVAPGSVVTVPWPMPMPKNASRAQIVNATIDATYGPTLINADLFLYDPTGQVVASNGQIMDNGKDQLAIEKSLKPGNYTIEARGCEGSGAVSITAVATLEYTRTMASMVEEAKAEHSHT